MPTVSIPQVAVHTADMVDHPAALAGLTVPLAAVDMEPVAAGVMVAAVMEVCGTIGRRPGIHVAIFQEAESQAWGQETTSLAHLRCH